MPRIQLYLHGIITTRMVLHLRKCEERLLRKSSAINGGDSILLSTISFNVPELLIQSRESETTLTAVLDQENGGRQTDGATT